MCPAFGEFTHIAIQLSANADQHAIFSGKNVFRISKSSDSAAQTAPRSPARPGHGPLQSCSSALSSRFCQNTKTLSSTVRDRETGDCASDTQCPARCPGRAGARAGTGGPRGARPTAVPSVASGTETGPLRPFLGRGAYRNLGLGGHTKSGCRRRGPAPPRAPARAGRGDTAAPRRPGGRPGAHAGSGQGPEGALRRGVAPRPRAPGTEVPFSASTERAAAARTPRSPLSPAWQSALSPLRARRRPPKPAHTEHAFFKVSLGKITKS